MSNNFASVLKTLSQGDEHARALAQLEALKQLGVQVDPAISQALANKVLDKIKALASGQTTPAVPVQPAPIAPSPAPVSPPSPSAAAPKPVDNAAPLVSLPPTQPAAPVQTQVQTAAQPGGSFFGQPAAAPATAPVQQPTQQQAPAPTGFGTPAQQAAPQQPQQGGFAGNTFGQPAQPAPQGAFGGQQVLPQQPQNPFGQAQQPAQNAFGQPAPQQQAPVNWGNTQQAPQQQAPVNWGNQQPQQNAFGNLTNNAQNIQSAPTGAGGFPGLQ